MTRKIKRIYKIDLRGYNINTYIHNPIVLEGYAHDKLPIGKATILSGKTQVEVEYFDNAPKYPHTIGVGKLQYIGRPDELITLLVIPVLERGQL